MRLLESDSSLFLLKYIIGAAVAGVGTVTTAAYQWIVAAADPHDLSMQPLHVILIGFIVALAAFIGLILRAVWTRLMPALNKVSSAMNSLSRQVDELNENLTKKTEHFDRFAFSVLRQKFPDPGRRPDEEAGHGDSYRG